MNLLAISGSLRAISINMAFLRAVMELAPEGVAVTLFVPGSLPLFNPDLEPAPPAEVLAFRKQVEAADAVLIATPEYAHGITGAIKNALDWLVSFPPFAGKPVAVVNTSPTAHHADAALREILRTMSADLLGDASTKIALLGAGLDEAAMTTTPWVRDAIRQLLEELSSAIAR